MAGMDKCPCPRDRPRRGGSGPGAPGLPEEDRAGREEGAQGDEDHAQLGDLVLEDRVGRQVGEDVLELVRALGRVILRPGRVGDRGQRALVDAAPEALATATTATTATTAEPAEPA